MQTVSRGDQRGVAFSTGVGRAAWAGTRLAGAVRRRLRGSDAPVRRILVARRARLGDLVVSLPLLRALRSAHPQAKIDLGVADAATARAVLTLAPSVRVDRVVAFDDGASRLERGLRTLRLLARGYDVLVTGERFSLVRDAFLCGAPLRVGFADERGRNALCNRCVPFDPERHAADNLLALAEALGGQPRAEERAPRLDGDATAGARDARAELRRLDVPDDARVVALHPGAQKPSRRWPAERFAALAEQLLVADGTRWCVFTGGPNEEALVERVRRLLPAPLRKRAPSAAARTDLAGLVRILDGCELLVCNDTGVLHLARARGVPLLALLGPENDAVWAPHPDGRAPAIAIRHRVPCAPCKRWSCEHLFCLRSLEVDEAFDAAQTLLASDAARRGGALERRTHDHTWWDLDEAGFDLPRVHWAPALEAASAGDPATRDEGVDYPAVLRDEEGAPERLVLVSGASAPSGPELGKAVAALVREPGVEAWRLGGAATDAHRPPRPGVLYRRDALARARPDPEAAAGAGGDDGPTTGTRLEELRAFLGDVVQYRDLLFQLTLRDIRIRYKQAVMGFAWALLMPALIVAAGSLVRLAIGYVSGSSVDVHDVAGMAVKALPWAFFVGALGFATSALVGNLRLVTKVYFPRAVLPISTTLAQTFDSLIGLATLFALLPVFGVEYTASMAWLPLLAAMLFLFTAGVGLIVSAANLFFRDVKYLVQVLLTFGIFFTPVFFEPSMFGPTGASLMMLLNPLSPLLEGMRLAVVEGHSLAEPLVQSVSGAEIVLWSPWYLAHSALVSLGTAAAGALLFRRLEPVFAEYV